MGGSEALEFLASSPTLPDVILLDIMMPDMSGWVGAVFQGFRVCSYLFRAQGRRGVPRTHACEAHCWGGGERGSKQAVWLLGVAVRASAG